MISGVIFDMDGLMTDTERLFIDLWCQIRREQGQPEYRGGYGALHRPRPRKDPCLSGRSPGAGF